MTKKLQTGTIHVFTFKEGLLSRVAHDLRLTLHRFEIAVDGRHVSGRFWPESLSVDGAIGTRGALDTSTPKPKDRREIHGNITDRILQTQRFPEVRFEGLRSGAGWALRGDLHMRGHSIPISIDAQVTDGILSGDVELTPSRWGIAPFKALLGAIRLQDRVRIRFKLPLGLDDYGVPAP